MTSVYTDPELDLLVERDTTAAAMVLRLAQTGSARFTQEVKTFQQAWNRARPVTNKQLQDLGQPPVSSLADDGRYGRNTAGALGLIIGAMPPTAASAIPLWYANNHELIAAISAPRTDDTQVILDSAQVITSPIPASVTVDQERPGGPSLQVVEQDPPPPAAMVPQIEAVYTTQVVSNVPEVSSAVQEVIGGGVAPEELELTFDEPTRVITSPPKTRFRWLAAGAGALTLGGAMWWWIRKNPRMRRRRAA